MSKGKSSKGFGKEYGLNRYEMNQLLVRGEALYKIRKEKEDKHMKAYKLMRMKKDGKVYPLFIDKTTPTKFGEWLPAECHPTKGFAVRQGWHCCFTPYAPHLKETLSNGEQRVWVEVEVEDYHTYDRPESQGGAWILANRMKAIRIITMEEAAAIRAASAKEDK